MSDSQDDLCALVKAKICAFSVIKDDDELVDSYNEVQGLVKRVPISQRDELVKSFHQEALKCRRRLEQQSHTQLKQRLFARSTTAGLTDGKKKSMVDGGDPAAALGEEISSQLRMMTRTMAEEIERTEKAAELLEQSTRRMQQTDDLHRSTLSSLLLRTRRLVSSLSRKENRDQLYIAVAVAIYVIVFIYVLCSRFFILRWFLSLLRFIYSLLYNRLFNKPIGLPVQLEADVPEQVVFGPLPNFEEL